jgi:hypothetical protein
MSFSGRMIFISMSRLPVMVLRPTVDPARPDEIAPHMRFFLPDRIDMNDAGCQFSPESHAKPTQEPGNDTNAGLSPPGHDRPGHERPGSRLRSFRSGTFGYLRHSFSKTATSRAGTPTEPPPRITLQIYQRLRVAHRFHGQRGPEVPPGRHGQRHGLGQRTYTADAPSVSLQVYQAYLQFFWPDTEVESPSPAARLPAPGPRFSTTAWSWPPKTRPRARRP